MPERAIEIEEIVQSGTMVATDTVYDYNLDRTQEDINKSFASFNDDGLKEVRRLSSMYYNLLAQINAKNYAAQGLEYDTEPTAGSTKMVRSGGIYDHVRKNITDFNLNDISHQPLTLSEAIALIPADIKKSGIKISFIDKYANKYVVYQNTSASYSDNPDTWEQLSSNYFNTTLTWDTNRRVTRLQVPEYNRKAGMIISYYDNTLRKPVSEQFKETVTNDVVWADDRYWQDVTLQRIENTLDSDNIDTALASAQGKVLKELAEEGYRYFGIITPASGNPNYKVRGFYFAFTEGEYINFIDKENSIPNSKIKVGKNEFGIVVLDEVGSNRWKWIKLPIASKQELKDIKDKIDKLENVKTKVLTEDEYAGLVNGASVESDRFYFTYEE